MRRAPWIQDLDFHSQLRFRFDYEYCRHAQGATWTERTDAGAPIVIQPDLLLNQSQSARFNLLNSIGAIPN